MSEPNVDLSDQDYDQIEDSLLSSARGRAFLRMRDRRHRAIAVEDVRRLLRDSRDQNDIDPRTHIRILRRELQELSAHIAQTRREIAALKPNDPSADRIMMATEELDAILQATEHATTEILNGAERVQSVADRLRRTHPDLSLTLDEEVTGIMTACSFQDITGQRMTKVVNTLRYIERRVHAMIGIWGDLDMIESGEDAGDLRPDSHLLHGPGARGSINQDAVDRLLSGAAAHMKALDHPAVATSAPSPAVGTGAPAPTGIALSSQTEATPAGPTGGGKPALSQSAVDDLFP